MRNALLIPPKAEPLLDGVEARRRQVARALEPTSKAALGQFMTPAPIAEFMASLFLPPESTTVRILDPGAGVGSLTAALVQEVCNRPGPAVEINATCYEIDQALVPPLRRTLEECRRTVEEAGLKFHFELRVLDFVEDAAATFAPRLFSGAGPAQGYTHTIINPPYRKIQTGSLHRRLLSGVGVETSNLYSAFVALAVGLLEPSGQLVAITPRSFCNGPYFLAFRRFLLDKMSILRIHTFELRDEAFKDDDVLQENIVFLAAKGLQSESVALSSSRGADLVSVSERIAPFSEIVRERDPNLIIHIATRDEDKETALRIAALQYTLDELGIQVSTGPVVDFRLKEYIHQEPSSSSVPLLYPAHFRLGLAHWPHPQGRKPSAIELSDRTRKWLMPSGYYAVTRRFSSKEERRRVVAALFDPSRVPGKLVGFENHLNVFHLRGIGLPPGIARGLCMYLNSTIVDRFFRLFNGHTQVNASDLRNLRYPGLDVLESLGAAWERGPLPPQESIDALVLEAISEHRGGPPQGSPIS
jgi:adenine-specific DNA-methyltransferase